MNEMIDIIKIFGFRVHIDPSIEKEGLEGFYYNKKIVLSQPNIKTFLHELCHAMEDNIGILNSKEKDIGELTAYIYTLMMYENVNNPIKIIASSLMNFYTSRFNPKYLPTSNVYKAIKRASSIYQLEVSEKIRNVIHGRKS